MSLSTDSINGWQRCPRSRFESMSFVVNILACKLKIVNNRNWKRHNKMVDRIRWDTVSYLPFYYVFFQFLLLTIFNLQANILTTKDILSNLALVNSWTRGYPSSPISFKEKVSDNGCPLHRLATSSSKHKYLFLREGIESCVNTRKTLSVTKN